MQVESPTAPLKDAKIWPLSVEAYHVLGDAGVIPPNTELLHGFVYTKMPKSPIQIYLLYWFMEEIASRVGPGKWLRSEQPIVCADSEPEPDISVVLGRKEDYIESHPRTAEFVVEICVSTHDYDRFKLQAYAAAGVKEVWLVLEPERKIEVYRDPRDGRFSEQTTQHAPGTISSLTVPEFRVDLEQVFSRPAR